MAQSINMSMIGLEVAPFTSKGQQAATVATAAATVEVAGISA